MGEPLRVLILEDKPRDAKLMVHELKRAGFDPDWHCVDTEEEYLTGLGLAPNVILADGYMPGFDASRALDVLRERGLEIPVIVVTGSLDDERAVEFMKQGAADYLLKDRLARLGQSVRQVIEKTRLAEEARRIQEERNRYFSLSLDLICVAGFDGYFKLLNPAWENTLGWSIEELLQRPYLEFVHADDQQATWEAATNEAGNPDSFAFENRFRCKDGSYRWLAWRSTVDRARGVVYATGRDTTERRRSEQHVRNVLESAPDAMVIVNPTGQIVLVNNQTEVVFGYDREEILGKPIEMLLPEQYRHKHIMLRDQFAREPHVRRIGPNLELFGRRKDGAEFPIEVSLSPLDSEEGVLTVSTIRDVTESKSLEKQLRHAQKMEAVGQLAGGVAHDFNNLLTIITGYSGVLLDQLPEADPARELLGAIYHAGERSAALTRQLLAFSRRQVIAPQVLDLGAVVEDTERMLRRLIGGDVRLRVANESGLWPVRADPGQLEQILLNLVMNARDAMPRGGTLVIETRNHEVSSATPERYVLLSVADTGIGMDAATKARIFEPFFTTKGDKGTGLGLATVYGIVKQANGQIEVESERGLGSKFTLLFPASVEALSAGGSTPGRGTMPRGTETILLIEDDEGVRSLSRHILSGCGYTLLEAGKGHDGIHLAASHHSDIHLLVTDVVMPDLGGRETADRVVEAHPETRVLFVSGYTDDAIIRRGVRTAEAAFLQKPFTPYALAQRVRDVLDERSPHC